MCAQVLQDEGLIITMQNHNAIQATKEFRIKTTEAFLSPARPLELSVQSRLVEVLRAKLRGHNDLEEVFIYKYLLPPLLPSSLQSAQLAQQHVPRPQSAKLIS